MLDLPALREETLRIHARYSIEIVEAMGFCPWAAAARSAGKVRTLVVFGQQPDAEQACLHVRAIARDENTDIGLLIFPELVLSRLDFQHFAARVRERYERPGMREPDGFALADFHPDAAPNLDSAALLVPFIRRSPDPTLQLVRHSALEAARRGELSGTRFVDASTLAHSGLETPAESTAPLHTRLAQANLKTVLRIGVEHVAARLDDILCDRDYSYGRLGLPPPPWSPLHRSSDPM
jgi:hypothetical protein